MKNLILVALIFIGTSLAAQATPNDQARESLRLIKMGMSIAGVEELFRIKNPKKISSSIKSDLKISLPPHHRVWTIANIKWDKKWASIFSEPTATIVQSSQMQAPLKPKGLKSAEFLVKTAKPDSNERARLLWVIAHHYALQNRPAKASPLLEELLNSDQSLIEPDLVIMTVARMYFQMNQLEKAIAHYHMISKDSDYWIESVEERAWAYFRKTDYDHVQSDMKTLMSPMFDNQVGPEPFFLDGFAKLKVCDYPGIFKIIKEFKTQFKDRLSMITDLEKTGSNAYVEGSLSTLANGPVNFVSAAKYAAHMPRFFYRDWELSRLAMRKAAFQEESKNKTSPLLVSLEKEAQSKLSQRVKALASIELDEARKILNKFHILEAEVIHRMHLQDKKNTKEIQHQTIADDELEFPVNDDEIWVDEVDKFQVLSRGCPDKKQEKTL